MNEPDPRIVELAHKIFDLARAGEADQIRDYIGTGVPVDLTDPDGNTLLMLASYNGQPSVVVTLLELGADANRYNFRGQTPLAGAIFKGEAEIVKALLAAGADPDLGQPTARAAAEMFGRTDLLP
ncbi:ankyrin repeat domain-containing protein [soil metagenome]